MSNKETIINYYSNAKELVKLKNPNAAKDYVRGLINVSASMLDSSKTFIERVNNENFIRQWAQVYFDLKDKGITDYVLKSFGLLKEANKPTSSKNTNEIPYKPIKNSSSDGGINMAGLIDDISSISNTTTEISDDYSNQGWVATVFNNNKNAVVEISIPMSDGSSIAGTGFIISKNGYILTNYHIVYDDEICDFHKNIKFALFGTNKLISLEPLHASKKDDIALCKFNALEIVNFSVIKLINDYSKVVQGADCVVIGNVFGLGLGPISGNVRFTKDKEVGDLVFSAPTNCGDSGAPVLNNRGECIGINKSRTNSINGTKAYNITNATPMDKIKAFLDKYCSLNGIVL